MKQIHVRETRPAERFNANDKFIAWYDGEAAGTMARSPSAAVMKLTGLKNSELNDSFTERQRIESALNNSISREVEVAFFDCHPTNFIAGAIRGQMFFNGTHFIVRRDNISIEFKISDVKCVAPNHGRTIIFLYSPI